MYQVQQWGDGEEKNDKECDYDFYKVKLFIFLIFYIFLFTFLIAVRGVYGVDWFWKREISSDTIFSFLNSLCDWCSLKFKYDYICMYGLISILRFNFIYIFFKENKYLTYIIIVIQSNLKYHIYKTF